MPTADLCSEEEIVQLGHGFYAAVRRDDVLGPIFDQHVKNWDAHLPTMVDFWSSALLCAARPGSGVRRYPSMRRCRVSASSCFSAGLGCSGKPRAHCRMRRWRKKPMTWPSAWRTACGTATRCARTSQARRQR